MNPLTNPGRLGMLISLFLFLCVRFNFQQTAIIPKARASSNHSNIPEDNLLAQGTGMILLSEDFEDGQAQSWNYNPTDWQIITDELTGSWSWTTLPANPAYASTGSMAWSDYRFQVQARRINSNANVYFRITQNNGYALRLENNRIVLWTERSGSPQELDSASYSVGSPWHRYTIDVVDNQISITVDDTLAITYNDGEQPSLSGGIALEAITSNGAHFDNILVTSLVDTPEQPDPWVQTNGPTGGVINTIELHPTNPDTVFASGLGGALNPSMAVCCGRLCRSSCLPAPLFQTFSSTRTCPR